MAKKTAHQSQTATRTTTTGHATERWITVVRSGTKLRILDIHTSAQRSEYSAEDKITALTWGHIVMGQPTVVALGLRSGKILLYSPTRDQVVRQLDTHSAVADLGFHNTELFSLDVDGTVVRWDLTTSDSVVLRTGVKDAQRLLVSGSRVVVASHRIEMWDFETMGKVHEWAGHTEPIDQLVWAPNETCLVSSATNDRHIHVWDTVGSVCRVLSVDSEILCIDVSPQGSVLAISDGAVHLWHRIAVAGDHSVGRRDSLGYPADGRLTIVSNTDTKLGVLQARFSRVAGDEGTLLVVRGSPIKPLFETLSVVDQNGQFSDLTVRRDHDPNLLIGRTDTEQQKKLNAQVHGYDESQATIISTTADPIGLADRIQRLSVGDPTRLSAGTLVRVLVQSLHTSDPEMLETVLMNSARPNIVRDTLLSLPTAYVLPFLQQLFVRFQETPQRAHQLLVWIRHTVSLHSAYLTSVPSLVPQLSGFYQALESRLESHQRLLRLSGRLELANMQIRARSHFEREMKKKRQTNSNKPLNVYHESDEEKEDEPLTPVWQAEESTDEEGSNEEMGDEGQWTDGESGEDEGSVDDGSDSEDESGSDESDSDDGMDVSDADEADKLML
ncbi:WD40-repeat-containing domain protein [Coemansia spiralis]|nr:WD40-repeat-containing domain protein [Coemansia spiralis]